MYKMKDGWIYYFGFILLCHDMISDENFRNIIDMITLL